MDKANQTPRCPSCGFTIFNPRHPHCERCAQPLPDALLKSDANDNRKREQDNQSTNTASDQSADNSDIAYGIVEGVADAVESIVDFDF